MKRMSAQEMVRRGWTRHDLATYPGEKPSKLTAVWKHRDGWVLQHCGHPTALWPWALYPPGESVQLVCMGNGHAWPDLITAADFVASCPGGGRKAIASWLNERLDARFVVMRCAS